MDAAERRNRVAALFDQLASGYDQGDVPWFTPIGSRLVELTRPRPGDRAVDIGAGRGAATFSFLDAVGEAGCVMAVDLSPVMMQLLQSEAAARRCPHLDTRVGQASTVDLKPGSFDVGTASLVLSSTPNPWPP